MFMEMATYKKSHNNLYEYKLVSIQKCTVTNAIEE